ncbi:MAG: hypothetical protein Q8P18_08590 [Pseudomonadota bacterium]|nr:hypothetical protein [Pseudomonadota bacterium]
MSEDEPKKKKKSVTRKVSAATALGTKSGLAAGPLATPPRIVQPKMTLSARQLLHAVSQKLVSKDQAGRFAITNPDAARRALENIGDYNWAAARMSEMEDAVAELNAFDIPIIPTGFVI